MSQPKQIKSALISVYHKDDLEPIVRELNDLGIEIYSTGGTQKFINGLGVKVNAVEDLTNYPSILGGRVKTLHPKIFGGILARRDLDTDVQQLQEYDIPEIDLVIVDLYPFEATVASESDEQAIIEKIDIGGISLIRAAAKNFKDTLIVASREEYALLLELLQEKKGYSDLIDRKEMARKAFKVSSHYDAAIFNYFHLGNDEPVLKQSIHPHQVLRYGENPHQQGVFYGQLDHMFDQLNGKALSYNNLVDIDAAVCLLAEFEEPTFAVLKHTNACGVATRSTLKEAWDAALSGDTISAFGGILICNRTVDEATAASVHELFFEVIIAPDYDPAALEILQQKKKRIILRQKPVQMANKLFKSLLNGVIEQDRDIQIETTEDFKFVSDKQPNDQETIDLLFANKVAKHTKSNTIVLVKGQQLVGSGIGQTSRVDALKQAIIKAKAFGFDLQGSVMASDAFFPFPDCVEIAEKAGITAVIQPGGSIRDQDSIDYCNQHNMAMVCTGFRHFKH